ncbi:MAG: hypothetical protein ACK4WH_12840 [Phycisphaerales bacterium]
MKLPDGKDLEKFDRDFLARHFSIDRIGRTNAKFDRAKLLSFNGDYLQQLTDDQFTARFLDWCRQHQPATATRLSELFPAGPTPLIRMAKPRAKTLRDVVKVIEFALTPDDQLAYDPGAVQKSLRANNDEGLGILRRFAPILESLEPFTPDALHAAMESFAARELPPDPAGKSNLGKLAQPLRVAITGSGVSPPVHESLASLGRTRSLNRVRRCLDANSGDKSRILLA